MRISCWCALALVTTVAPLIARSEQLASIQAENLLGHAVTLPGAATGRVAVLIIGFTHGSQTQCKAWSQKLQQQFPPASHEAMYSIAVLQDVPRLVRGMAVHGIKSGVPQEQRDHFLLVYRNEAALKHATGFSEPDDAYLIVLDLNGAVRWRFHGPVTASAVEQLTAQIRALEQSGAK